VGEQAVIAHTDAEASGSAIEHNGNGQRFPGKEEKSGDGAHVKQDHERGGRPV
jgi:hypothetical protein